MIRQLGDIPGRLEGDYFEKKYWNYRKIFIKKIYDLHKRPCTES